MRNFQPLVPISNKEFLCSFIQINGFVSVLRTFRLAIKSSIGIGHLIEFFCSATVFIQIYVQLGALIAHSKCLGQIWGLTPALGRLWQILGASLVRTHLAIMVKQPFTEKWDQSLIKSLYLDLAINSRFSFPDKLLSRWSYSVGLHGETLTWTWPYGFSVSLKHLFAISKLIAAFLNSWPIFHLVAAAVNSSAAFSVDSFGLLSVNCDRNFLTELLFWANNASALLSRVSYILRSSEWPNVSLVWLILHKD